MALVTCHECGNETSTEAKTCPQCGARNRKHKGSGIIRFGGFFLFVVFAFVIYSIYEEDLNPRIPACGTDRAGKIFVDTFDNGPYAQSNHIRAIDVRSQKSIGDSSAASGEICEVVFRLNNGTDKTYIFSFENKEDGGYFISGKPK